MTPPETPIFASGRDLDRIANDKSLRALSRTAGKLRHLAVHVRTSRPVANQEGSELDEALGQLQQAAEAVLEALAELTSDEDTE